MQLDEEDLPFHHTGMRPAFRADISVILEPLITGTKILFTCRGSCEQRFVAHTAEFVVTLHDGGHVGKGRGGREEGELQRIQHPSQHGCPINRE